MARGVASFPPAVRPQRPAVAERLLVRENDDWDEDGVELRPLVDSARSHGDSSWTSNSRQRNAAIGYCCLMFMFCLGAQLATRVDPDAIRNAIPFITHSCDGKGCERTVMIQRWSLALAVFFAVLAAATACEHELHHGWWPLKISLLFLLLYSSLALPTVAISVYIQVSIILSSAFILMQHIILVDWGYTLSSSWGRRERWWLVSLLLLSLSLVIGSVAWSIYDIVMYSSCRRTSTMLLIVTTITIVASVLVKHGSILTAGVVCIYSAQLVWSALQESDCSIAGPTSTSTGSFHQDSISASIASLLVMVSLVYSSMDASTRQSAFSLDGGENERSIGTFSYPLFHFVFSLGSMYMGMVLTGWSSELNEDSGLKNRYVVKIASAFVLHAVYLWTLAAPTLLSNRRFDYDDL